MGGHLTGREVATAVLAWASLAAWVVLFVGAIIRAASGRADDTTNLTFLPFALFAFIPYELLRRDALNRRRRKILDRVCTHCGYNLTGNVSGVCPECGTAVTGKAGT